MAFLVPIRVQRNEEVTLLGEKVNNFVGLLGCQVHLKATKWMRCPEIANSTFLCSTRAEKYNDASSRVLVAIEQVKFQAQNCLTSGS